MAKKKTPKKVNILQLSNMYNKRFIKQNEDFNMLANIIDPTIAFSYKIKKVTSEKLVYTHLGKEKTVTYKDVIKLPREARAALKAQMDQLRYEGAAQAVAEGGGRSIRRDDPFEQELLNIRRKMQTHSRKGKISLKGIKLMSQTAVVKAFNKMTARGGSDIKNAFYHEFGAKQLDPLNWFAFNLLYDPDDPEPFTA